jgi:hypothetical protein
MGAKRWIKVGTFFDSTVGAGQNCAHSCPGKIFFQQTEGNILPP